MLAHTDAATGRPFVDVVADRAEQKGTGRWTVQSALDLGVPITGIAEATFARSLSGHADQREAAQRAFADRAADTDPASRRGPERSSSRTCATPCTPRRSSPTRRASTTSRPAARSTAGTSTGARWPPSGAAAASSGPGSSTASGPRTRSDPELDEPAGRAVLRGRGQRRARRAGAGCHHGRARGHPDADVLLVARLLRRAAPPAAARRAHPGPARQLRRAHLPAGRPRGLLPHALGGRQGRSRGLIGQDVAPWHRR